MGQEVNKALDRRVDEQRWISVYNDTGEEIPPLSFVTPTGVAFNGGIVVGKIGADGDDLAMVTGDDVIPKDSWGRATRDFPTRVQYDTGDGTPATLTLERWGPKANNFKARKNVSGWFLYGPAVSSMQADDLEVGSSMIELEVCRTT